MTHRIGRKEDIGAALFRLVGDDLEAAEAALDESGEAERRIHRVRQRLKRTRSVLRVLRPALGETARRAGRKLRDAAHLLAGARDADAAVASARSLSAAADGGHAGFDRVIPVLDREAESTHAEETPTGEASRLVASARREIMKAMPDDIDGDALLRRAIDRAFRRGRTAMQDASFSLATPDLHRWRKEVKDLWHLIRLSRRRLPGRAGPMARQLKQLGEVLGVDHDHAMLAERLALSPTGDPSLMNQLALIAKERRTLEMQAFALGLRLYRRKPKTFRKRMRLR